MNGMFQHFCSFYHAFLQDDEEIEREIHEEITEEKVEVVDAQKEIVQDEKEEMKDKTDQIKIEVVEQPMMVSEVKHICWLLVKF